MKTAFHLFGLLLFCLTCAAQDDYQLPDKLQFFAFGDAEKDRELLVTGDSLCFITYKHAQIIKHSCFSVEKLRKEKDVLYAFVKKHRQVAFKPVISYSMLALAISEDKSRLGLVEENKKTYATLEACLEAASTFRFERKFAFTYYDGQTFERYKKYRSIEQVDSTELQGVYNTFHERIKASKPLVLHTKNLDPYGGGLTIEIMTSVLIGKEINPATSFKRLSDRAVELKVTMPAFEPRRTGKRVR